MPEVIAGPPELVDLPLTMVVGLSFNPEQTDWSLVPTLWFRLCHRLHEVAHRAEPEVSYGFIHPSGQAGIDCYLAGVAVSSFDDQPADLAQAVIPGGQYAVFTVRGGLGSIGAAYQYINHEWLPNSPYREARCGAVEVYGPSFVADLTSWFQIRMAVTPR